MLTITTPPPNPLVAASVLSADFGRMADECRDVLDKGADLLHLDVMDGHFVPNLTMGRDMIAGLRQHFPGVYLDVHLMVERPGEYVEDFAAAGANMFSFHLEVTRPMRPDGEDAMQLIDRIHDAGMNAGMAINPPTAPDGLERYLQHLELVLVMSVNPGRSGQKFMAHVLDKTRAIKDSLPGKTRLEMDGGISPQTAGQAAAAGVDVFVTASALFGSQNRGQLIDALHRVSG